MSRINKRINSTKSGGHYSAGRERLCRAACVCVWVTLTQLQKIRAFGSVWRMAGMRRAEGDSLARRVTHISYRRHGTHTQAHTGPSVFCSLGFRLFGIPAGDCRLKWRWIKNNIWESGTRGQSVSGQACYNPITLISRYNQCAWVSVCVCVREAVWENKNN